jgi:glycosyltransferase involved in cell wall biosynthesis
MRIMLPRRYNSALPQFSIVIPVYTREREIRRAVASCLSQDLADFELIVVDDASVDNSAGVVESFRDPRVRLIRLDVNAGPNRARLAGIDAASADWVVCLDSDDELLPGALSCMSSNLRSDVERLAFMYERDDGRVSPLPALREGIVDYASYAAWLEGRVFYDFLACTQRSTFEHVRWQAWSDHCLYNLDFASRYRTLFCSETLGKVHTDASSRASRLLRAPDDASRHSAALGRDMDVILSRHGDVLRRHAPRTFQMFQRMRASWYFLCRERRQGLKQSARCLRETPLLADAWLIPLLGVVSPRALAEVRSWRLPAT